MSVNYLQGLPRDTKIIVKISRYYSLYVVMECKLKLKINFDIIFGIISAYYKYLELRSIEKNILYIIVLFYPFVDWI